VHKYEFFAFKNKPIFFKVHLKIGLHDSRGCVTVLCKFVTTIKSWAVMKCMKM